MKRHTITEDDVRLTIDTAKVLLAASSGENKQLYLKPSKHGLYYLVFHNDKIVFDTLSLDAAIERYNDQA